MTFDLQDGRNLTLPLCPGFFHFHPHCSPHSPNNFVTKAQASAVFEVKSSTDAVSYVWLGNQWNSGLALTPPGPRNHDLLYWSVLKFDANESVSQFNYSTTTVVDLGSQ